MADVQEIVHKVTLSTGKVVLIRDLKIKHTELAGKALGNRNADAPVAQSIALQAELLKILLADVGGKAFKASDSLDSVLSMVEYNQCLKVVSKLSGAGDTGDPLMEIVSSGSK